jgi:tRNA (guanine37-N1)-methyltransferase
MITISVLTLFPQIIHAFVNESIVLRAQQKALVQFNLVNLRDFTTDKRQTVDDHPLGGGAGMLLKIEPLVAGIESIENNIGPAQKILLTPKGITWNQTIASDIIERSKRNNLPTLQPFDKFRASSSNLPTNHLLLICGHYEGFDARIEHFVDTEISLGNYVLGSGESAAMVIIDTLVRLIPGVLKKPEAIINESFSSSVTADYLFEYPQYALPREFRGLKVPAVLLSGNHQKIEQWRKEKAREETNRKRRN